MHKEKDGIDRGESPKKYEPLAKLKKISEGRPVETDQTKLLGARALLMGI